MLSIFFGWMLFAAVGCSRQESTRIGFTTDFVRIETRGEDVLATLNAYLRANPDRRVTAFSGVGTYNGNNCAYLLATEQSDNANQIFDQLNPAHSSAGIREDTLLNLQNWKDSHKEARLISFATVPGFRGGIESCVLCCETLPGSATTPAPKPTKLP